jgi:hypothetical protein
MLHMAHGVEKHLSHIAAHPRVSAVGTGLLFRQRVNERPAFLAPVIEIAFQEL